MSPSINCNIGNNSLIVLLLLALCFWGSCYSIRASGCRSTLKVRGIGCEKVLNEQGLFSVVKLRRFGTR
jgi:hypothetical protein